MNFFRLASELISFLRGQGGECQIAGKLLRNWGQREYASHLRRLFRHKVISQTGDPSIPEHKAATIKLLWPEHPGDPVTDLLDGFAEVMTEQEIREVFKGRPGTTNAILDRMKRLGRIPS
jgi:hypothetical protein